MSTLTPEDRARLRDLAAKATPGEWSPADPYGHPALYADGQSIAHGDECGDLNIGDDNLAYISSVDPATVTALLNALDEAEVARELLWEAGESTAQEAVGWRQKALNAEAERDSALARIKKVRESLAAYAARDHDDMCVGDTYCGRDVAEEALDALDGEVEA